eukprot:scaffold25018_cov86-Skeletonema_dohrnii-CCMP3373.AAC.1
MAHPCHLPPGLNANKGRKSSEHLYCDLDLSSSIKNPLKVPNIWGWGVSSLNLVVARLLLG